MVKHLLLAIILASFNLISNSASAKKVTVDTYVTADNGCKFHVTGWVDVGISFIGITVDHYDITMDGDCGHYHFTGMVTQNGGGIVIMDAKLTNLGTGQDGDIRTSPFRGSLISILRQLEAEYHE